MYFILDTCVWQKCVQQTESVIKFQVCCVNKNEQLILFKYFIRNYTQTYCKFVLFVITF